MLNIRSRGNDAKHMISSSITVLPLVDNIFFNDSSPPPPVVVVVVDDDDDDTASFGNKSLAFVDNDGAIQHPSTFNSSIVAAIPLNNNELSHN
jgi:hypothetical protein